MPASAGNLVVLWMLSPKDFIVLIYDSGGDANLYVYPCHPQRQLR